MKFTGLLVALFFATSLTLGYLATKQARRSGHMAKPVPVSAPARQSPADKTIPVINQPQSPSSSRSSSKGAIPDVPVS